MGNDETMKLYEYQGKELFAKSDIKVPANILLHREETTTRAAAYKEFFEKNAPLVLKAQVGGGKRGKAGLIKSVTSYEESLNVLDALYEATYNGQPLHAVLAEAKLAVAGEHYLSILYDTRERAPVILLSRHGGVNVEDETKKAKPARLVVNPLDGLKEEKTTTFVTTTGFTGEDIDAITQLLMKAYTCFTTYDCRQLEINPVIKTANGDFYAGDAKVTIDDSALGRQEGFSHETGADDKTFLSERALKARTIDAEDHRGVAGKTYVELDGDIAVLASGGGASLTCMDALLEAGGKPANYTEYSGDPSKEKVRRLTEITLSKPGLKGCLVVGGTANFTDILETLTGFAEGLLNVQPKPTYPIVVRRWGPKAKEAFAMLAAFKKEHGFDIALYGEETPMTAAARILVEKMKAREGGGEKEGAKVCA